MKTSDLRQIIREEIRKVLNEAAATPALKPLDFDKLDKIFDVLTAPNPDLEESGYESLSNGEVDFKDVTKFLKKLGKAHAKGDEKFVDFIAEEENTDLFPSDVTVEDNVINYLKDKNLAKQIQKLNDIFYDMNSNLSEIEPEDVIRSYNKLADFVNKFNIKLNKNENIRIKTNY